MNLIGMIRGVDGSGREVDVDAADHPTAFLAVEAQMGEGETLLSVREP